MDMGVGKGMAVIIAMRVPVATRMVVTMGAGSGWNHAKMLYYNIKPVHGLGVIPGRTTCKPGISRQVLFRAPRGGASE